jgi:hypothetical protein
MPYEAEISRSNPTCFLFLVDHSTSMQDPIMGIPGNPKKSQFAADAINKVIQSLVVSASKDMEIRRYYQIGVIGYGLEVKSLMTGFFEGVDLAWVDEIYEHPVRIEERIWNEEDENGNISEVKTKFPVWVEPVNRGQTPMCAALKKAIEIISQWVQEYPNSYPPTVINLTDGESNDGDARIPAEELRNLSTLDGNTILLTVHASSNPYSQQIFFPDNQESLPDHFSKNMFQMSSILTPNMRKTSSEILDIILSEKSRGFVYNADITGVVQALEIGTRPANLP